jgi:hypothetical protein
MAHSAQDQASRTTVSACSLPRRQAGAFRRLAAFWSILPGKSRPTHTPGDQTRGQRVDCDVERALKPKRRSSRHRAGRVWHLSRHAFLSRILEPMPSPGSSYHSLPQDAVAATEIRSGPRPLPSHSAPPPTCRGPASSTGSHSPLSGRRRRESRSPISNCRIPASAARDRRSLRHFVRVSLVKHCSWHL